jgi:hypothetical protein
MSELLEAQPKKISWVKQVYQRVPWLRVRYGKTVAPQKDQKSNLTLDDAQVMQKRDDPVSHAFPLSRRQDVGEESNSKRRWPGT